MADLVYHEFARRDQAEGTLEFENAADVNYGSTGYLFSNPTPAELNDLVPDIIGGIDYAVQYTPQSTSGYGGIRRLIPKRHPLAINMFARKITDIRGVGKYTPVDSDSDFFVDVIPGFPLYDQYEVRVNYDSPLYNIYKDEMVKTLTSQYYNYLGNRVLFRYSDEWIRYTSWTEEPVESLISGRYGQMVFQTSDNTKPGKADILESAAFAGYPYQTLPDSVIRMHWHQVPYSFITSTNSYLRNLPLGLINQNDFFYSEPGSSNNKIFKAGSLRWGGYSFSYYNPAIGSSNGSYFGTTLGLNNRKTCDIELRFFRTNRDRFAERVPTTLPNPNYIPKGWNLQPWLKTPNKYYYTHWYDPDPDSFINDAPDPATFFPCHYSFPFELLFTNPDLPQIEPQNMLEVLA